MLCVFDKRVIYLQLFEPLRILQVVSRLARLEFYASQPFADFAQDICKPEQVLFRSVQLSERLFLVRFVFAYAGGFFKYESSVRFRRTYQILNLSLFEDRIGLGTNAGVHKQFADIFEAADFIVYPVLALPAFIYLSCYLHLVSFDRQLSRSDSFGI